MQSNFERSLAHVLVHQGGFSDHPQDPGGVEYVVFDQAVDSGPGRSARWLQEARGIEADGEFGPATDAALRAYQEAEGLVADDVVRRNTYRSLGLVE